MIWGLLADATVALHAAFILFALLGAALLPRWPRLVWLHAPALIWGCWIEASGGLCPLTPIENGFRAQAGQGGYGGGFIDHYVTPIIYPEGLTRGTQLVYGGILVTMNMIFYALWLHGKRRATRQGMARQ